MAYAQGRVITQTDAALGVTQFSYDDSNRLTRITNPLGGVRIHRHDATARDGLCVARELAQISRQDDRGADRTAQSDDQQRNQAESHGSPIIRRMACAAADG